MSAGAVFVTPQPTTKRRTAGRKRVYGKRKVDAPRAVFETRSPPKDGVKEKKKNKDGDKNWDKGGVDDGVGSLEAKMAGMKLELSTSEVEEEKPVEDVVVFSDDEEKDEQKVGEGSDMEEMGEQVVGLHALKSEPDTADSLKYKPEPPPKKAPSKPQSRYQTMLGVCIDTRRPTPESTEESPSTTQSSKNKSTPAPSSTRRSPAAESAEPQSTSTTRIGEKSNPSIRKKTVPRRSSGVVHDEKATEYARRILNEAHSPMAAQGVQKFSSWAARGGNMLDVVKIAEGSYGEVYKMHLREEVCKQEMSKSKLAKLRSYGDNVIKVMPLRAAKGQGSKKFTSVEEIVSEIKMLKYLDPIPGFARFREIHVVQGRFPPSFQEAWDHYKQTKDDCFNPNPSNKKAYPDSQMWAIIEMDDAGCELEKFAWTSVFQVYDIFWGVAMALARAEEYALFEHRDLHLGNVCIRTTRENGCMDPPTAMEVMSKVHSSGFGLSTLETTIIDYSLSRAELRLSEDPEAPAEVASSDLDKKQLFDAIGVDEDDALLRDTYRHMRAEVYSGNPADTEKLADIPGIWLEYAPGTNLVWLGFLLKNLLKKKKPEPKPTITAQRKPLTPCTPNKNLTSSNTDKKQSGKPEKQRPIKQISSAEASRCKDMYAHVLQDRLDAVLELLDIEHRHQDMCCAADLVAYAIDSQWLVEEDFF